MTLCLVLFFLFDVDAFLFEHRCDGLEEDLHVEGEADVAHVVNVHLQAIVPGQRVAAVHGGVAGDAGLDEKLLALVSLVELGFAL